MFSLLIAYWLRLVVVELADRSKPTQSDDLWYFDGERWCRAIRESMPKDCSITRWPVAMTGRSTSRSNFRLT